MARKRKNLASEAGEDLPENQAIEGKAVQKGLLSRLKQRVFTKEFLLVLLIFLVAFGVRAHLMQQNYQYFFEFDSYFHARMTEYLLVNGHLPEDGRDPLAYYQIGYSTVPDTGPLFWQINAILYKIGSPAIM